MNPLIHTVVARPYVFIFLLTFLTLAILHFGVLRALAWLLIGYSVALLSEVSSIRNGFPYGLYHYIYASMPGELMVGGVPVWDSASYAFIAYASFATAWFLLEPHFLQFSIDPHLSPSRPLAVSSISALLMMLADVVIDPVANLGEKWFLGKIYFYPTGGLYFGVPLTNFAGWLCVAFVIIAGFQLLEKFIFIPMQLPVWGSRRFRFQALLGPAFYFGILIFNLSLTLYVQANFLFACSLMITLALLGMVVRKF